VRVRQVGPVTRRPAGCSWLPLHLRRRPPRDRRRCLLVARRLTWGAQNMHPPAVLVGRAGRAPRRPRRQRGKVLEEFHVSLKDPNDPPCVAVLFGLRSRRTEGLLGRTPWARPSGARRAARAACDRPCSPRSTRGADQQPDLRSRRLRCSAVPPEFPDDLARPCSGQ